MRSRADRFAAALAGLVEEHGESALAGSDRILTEVVSLVLSRHTGAVQARKAVKALIAEFVDWNEVRISYVREISGVLAASGVEGGTKAVAGALTGFLNRLYRDHNAVSLAAVKAMEPLDAFAYLRSIEFLDVGVAAATFALLFDPPDILHAPEILRLPGRLGLAGKRATQAKVRKSLETLMEGDARILGHLYFALHSEDVCRARAPRCTECCISGICEYGKGVLKSSAVVRTPAKKAPPAKEPANKPVRKKAARKKAPVKKPAVKKSPAKKPVAKKAPAKKAPAKKAPAKKAPAKKAPAGKAASRKPSSRGGAGKKRKG